MKDHHAIETVESGDFGFNTTTSGDSEMCAMCGAGAKWMGKVDARVRLLDFALPPLHGAQQLCGACIARIAGEAASRGVLTRAEVIALRDKLSGWIKQTEPVVPSGDAIEDGLIGALRELRLICIAGSASCWLLSEVALDDFNGWARLKSLPVDLLSVCAWSVSWRFRREVLRPKKLLLGVGKQTKTKACDVEPVVLPAELVSHPVVEVVAVNVDNRAQLRGNVRQST